MSTYFPFPSAMVNASISGLGAGFDLNLSYARLAVLLAPQPVPLVYPPLGQTRQNDSSWKVRVKAVESAWTKMREETEKRKIKGKGKAVDSWAMDEIAAWVVDLLVCPNPQVLRTMLTEYYSHCHKIFRSLLSHQQRSKL